MKLCKERVWQLNNFDKIVRKKKHGIIDAGTYHNSNIFKFEITLFYYIVNHFYENDKQLAFSLNTISFLSKSLDWIHSATKITIYRPMNYQWHIHNLHQMFH
jgi:hypothetical protein